MRSTILTAVALVLFSSFVMAQSTDTMNQPTTGPAAQSDSMSNGDMTKDKMSKKKMSKSEKMKKTHAKM
jgi:pentapeptide MXKDX repeat protein